MSSPTRRTMFAALGLLPAAGALAAHGDAVGGGSGAGAASAGAAARKFAPAVSGREVMRQRYFPNVILTTHEGRRVRFYDDLLKDKIVVLSMMYADCTGICPLITANLVRAKKILGDRVGRDLFIYSITVKPEVDTPERLREYAQAHEVGPGWLFLTGSPGDVELLRHKLGFVDANPEVDRDKSRHSGMVRYGNEPLALWGSCQGQAKPEWIAEEISFVIRKPPLKTNVG
jgi:protein SCO1/2